MFGFWLNKSVICQICYREFMSGAICKISIKYPFSPENFLRKGAKIRQNQNQEKQVKSFFCIFKLLWLRWKSAIAGLSSAVLWREIKALSSDAWTCLIVFAMVFVFVGILFRNVYFYLSVLGEEKSKQFGLMPELT